MPKRKLKRLKIQLQDVRELQLKHELDVRNTRIKLGRNKTVDLLKKPPGKRFKRPLVQEFSSNLYTLHSLFLADNYMEKAVPEAKRLDNNKRVIQLRFKEPYITDEIRQRVWRYYRNKIALNSIVQQVNGLSALNERISLADCYMILYDGMRQKPTAMITQRKCFSEIELKINEFVQVYNAWRSGMKTGTISERFSRCPVGVERLIRSLNLRLANNKSKVEADQVANAHQILAKANVEVFNGRNAFVIYMDDLTQAELSEFKISNPASLLVSNEIVIAQDKPDLTLYANRKLLEHAGLSAESEFTEHELEEIATRHASEVNYISPEDEREEILKSRKAEDEMLENFPVEIPSDALQKIRTQPTKTEAELREQLKTDPDAELTIKPHTEPESNQDTEGETVQENQSIKDLL